MSNSSCVHRQEGALLTIHSTDVSVGKLREISRSADISSRDMGGDHDITQIFSDERIIIIIPSVRRVSRIRIVVVGLRIDPLKVTWTKNRVLEMV